MTILYTDFYFDNKNKKDFSYHLPTIIKNNSCDYNPFFVTFTFNDIKASYRYEDYRIFFRYMYQRFNNALALNAKAFKKAPVLILIPETDPAIHFHGFLLVHKKTSIRFMKNCVETIGCQDGEDKISFHLPIKIRDPYPKKMKFEKLRSAVLDKYHRELPMLHTHRAYPMMSATDIDKSASYCGKHFAKSAFTCDDLIIEKRSKPEKYKRPEHLQEQNV